MVTISFIVIVSSDGLYAGSNGAGRKRTADLLAIIQQDQRLGGAARSQIKEQLLFLGGLGQPFRTGRTRDQDNLDAIGTLHIPKANMYESLRGERHKKSPPSYEQMMMLIGKRDIMLVILFE